MVLFTCRVLLSPPRLRTSVTHTVAPFCKIPPVSVCTKFDVRKISTYLSMNDSLRFQFVCNRPYLSSTPISGTESLSSRLLTPYASTFVKIRLKGKTKPHSPLCLHYLLFLTRLLLFVSRPLRGPISISTCPWYLS